MTEFRKDPLSYKPGDKLGGRYEIDGKLGQGGYGAVYSATHTGTHQAVAIKVLSVDPDETQDDVVRRFWREARVTAQLRSYNTVRVFDVGEIDGGNMFMAMEMLRGLELEVVLRRLKKAGRRMSEEQAVDIATQVLKSLHEAHRAGLVHRDLKPANIMLAQMDDDEPVVKVLDFGVARTADSTVTQGRKALGTPAYMSPEQCRALDLDGRADLYSLGVILFRCLTGRLPFESRDPVVLLGMHVHEPVPDPRDHNETLTHAMGAVIKQALAKSPDDRFADARAMRDALRAALGGAWGGTPAAPQDALESRAYAESTAGTETANGDAPDGGGDVRVSVDHDSSEFVAGGGPKTLTELLVVDGEDLMAGAVSKSQSRAVALDPGEDGNADEQEASRSALIGSVEPAASGAVASKAGWGAAALVLLLLGVGGAIGLASGGNDERAPENAVNPDEPVVPRDGAPRRGAPPSSSTEAGPNAAPKPLPIQRNTPVTPDSAPATETPKPDAQLAAAAQKNRALAEAKAQIAATTADLDKKIALLKEAVALDEANPKYPILLETFAKEAAARVARHQRAVATKPTAKPRAPAGKKTSARARSGRTGPTAKKPAGAEPKTADAPIKFESFD